MKEVSDIIVEEIQPEKVFLFGSYVLGRNDKNSDVDFIIVVNKAFEKRNRIDEMVRLNLKTALPNLLFPKDFKMYSMEEYKKLKKIVLLFCMLLYKTRSYCMKDSNDFSLWIDSAKNDLLVAKELDIEKHFVHRAILV
jgi:predicted nucleotidyltransferase